MAEHRMQEGLNSEDRDLESRVAVDPTPKLLGQLQRLPRGGRTISSGQQHIVQALDLLNPIAPGPGVVRRSFEILEGQARVALPESHLTGNRERTAHACAVAKLIEDLCGFGQFVTGYVVAL